jgi:hypothetical protein
MQLDGYFTAVLLLYPSPVLHIVDGIGGGGIPCVVASLAMSVAPSPAIPAQIGTRGVLQVELRKDRDRYIVSSSGQGGNLVGYRKICREGILLIVE